MLFIVFAVIVFRLLPNIFLLLLLLLCLFKFSLKIYSYRYLSLFSLSPLAFLLLIFFSYIYILAFPSSPLFSSLLFFFKFAFSILCLSKFLVYTNFWIFAIFSSFLRSLSLSLHLSNIIYLIYPLNTFSYNLHNTCLVNFINISFDLSFSSTSFLFSVQT